MIASITAIDDTRPEDRDSSATDGTSAAASPATALAPIPPVATPRDLLNQIEERLTAAPGLLENPTAQRLFGDLIGVISMSSKVQTNAGMDAARMAAQLLLRPEPRVEAAGQLVEFLIGLTGYRKITSRRSPAFQVFLGLATCVPLIGATLASVRSMMHTGVLPHAGDFSGVAIGTIIAVIIAGGLGSMVSMMARIQSFELLRLSDPWLPFLTGLFRPIIGVAFALFVAACIQSGLLPVAVDADKQVFLMLAVAFVAGFSERLAPDLIGKVESRMAKPADEPPAKAQTP